MTTIAQGRVSGLVDVRWTSGTDITAGSPWFAIDLKPGLDARKRFALDDSFTVVKHTLQLFVPSSTVVNVIYKFNAIDKTFILNGGTALVAGAPFQFDLILIPGSTYNITHVTTNQNVAAIITESFNVDI